MTSARRNVPRPRRSTAALLALGGLAACHAVPPPPILPMHVGTAPEPRGSTTAMVVIGFVAAGDFVFSSASGVGVAVRVEHQAYDQTALGVQLGGGHGDEGKPTEGPVVGHTLVAVEGYGRRSFTDWTAVTYGAGASWFSTGLWTLDGHAGLAVSVPNDYAVPVLRLAVAGTVPITPGEPFGYVAPSESGLCFACEHQSSPSTSQRTVDRAPVSELFLIGNLGVVVPIAGGNRLSLDLGYAHTHDQGIAALSVADAQR